MWPLSGSEILRVCGGSTSDPNFAERSFSGASIGERFPLDDELFFALADGQRDLHAGVAALLARGASHAVVSGSWRGLDALSAVHRGQCIVVDDTLQALRRLAAYLREKFTFPVVAVGGSNGKTTTKDMIAALLGGGGERVTKTAGTNNGWVGVPLTLCSREHRRAAPPSALVLEIGIDARGAMQDHVQVAAPDLAVLTALGCEHLDGLGTWEEAIAEELCLFTASRRVWLADDPALARRLGDVGPADAVVHRAEAPVHAPCPTLAYRYTSPTPFEGELDLVWRGERPWAGCVKVPLPGKHNGTNAALAFAAGLVLGRSPANLLEGWRSFVPPAGRCDVRRLWNGAIVVDDSYNASPASVSAALDVIAHFGDTTEKLVILGDMLDLGAQAQRWHSEIAPRLSALNRVHVRLYGDAVSAVAGELNRALSVARVSSVEDPRVLLDLPSYDDTLVLVKGSRGMHLERVVAALVAQCEAPWNPETPAVGVVGADAADAARILRRELGSGVIVRTPSARALAEGLAQRVRFTAAVMTRFAPMASDPARELAELAQLFLHLADGGAAFFADEPTASLLEAVLPSHARCARISADWVALARAVGAHVREAHLRP